MKKIYALFLALMVCAVSFAALNPYAYALSSQLSADETTLTVNYSLNADATEVNVVILNGEVVVKTIPCTGITKGAYTIEIPTTELPKLATLTWRVDVTGKEVTTATEHSVNYDLYHPSSIDIDNNPESPYFGRILTNDAMQKVATDNAKPYLGYGFGAGIFAFNAAFEPIKNGDKPGFNGGNTFTNTRPDDVGQTAYAPRRVRISEDGRIFVSSLNTNGNVLWELNPANLDEWTEVISGTRSSSTINEVLNANGTYIGGPNVGFDVRGKGENLQLLMLSGIGSFKCNEYNLGTATSWNVAPTKEFNIKGYVVSYTGSNIEYDNEGGFWICQYRGTAKDSEPSLVHFNAEGVEDYKEKVNYRRNGAVRFNNDYTKLIVAGVDAGTANSKKATIYAVSKDANGKPILTKETEVSMATIGNNLNDFAVDYAGNLYSCGNGNEKIVAYALPHAADAIVSTPAASRYAFQLQEEVAGTFYTLTLNVDETAGSVIGNNGQYLEGETATLTATANRGYKFTSWTVGEETVTENPLTITVNANTTVTANFDALAAYTITATANDATMGTVEGAGTYYAGETVTLKATANEGHNFVNWSNDATTEAITFEATEDVTLTANFAKNLYTLTVNVNDPEKGSVDKTTATYEYGTEVTLTATPKAGYELLAWSDRSTNETLTLTMTADKAVTAYFVTSYVNEPEFKVEKVWEYSENIPATGNGYQAVGWDGVIYMQDAGNSKIKTITAEGITEYAASGAGQQIAIDEAGNLIVFNAYFATATPGAIKIFQKGSTVAKDVTFTLLYAEKCHFFSASGDIFSADGGYIYFYCYDQKYVNRVKITNGAATAADVTVDAVGGAITAGNTQNHVMVDIWGNLVAHSRSNGVNEINFTTNASKPFTLPSIKMATLGGCSFELAGKEFWAYHAASVNYSSEWNLYNMTDAKFVSDTTFYVVDRTEKNKAANWLNAQVIDNKTAYIYQFYPNGGAAVWKVTANFVKPATPVIEVSEEAVMTITCETENAVIYFDYNFEEFDGEVAENDENKYEEAIALSTSDDVIYQVEAIAVLDGEVSDVATATFEVKDGAISVDLDAIGALAVVYSKDGQLYVQTEVGTMIEVYSLQGQVLYAGEAAADLTAIDVNEKVVLVRVAGETVKAVIK